jgi:predicted MPP superfamily phosphohydrolase
MLDNARCFLGSNRTLQALASRGLCFAGVGDLYQDRQDYQAALGGLPAAMPRLLLSHNPDVAEEKRFIASGLRVDLMLCGHTHGGQVRIPLVGTPVVPSRYGQKYAAGLVRGPVCSVFICRGVGLSVLPVRMGVRPEVAILELKPGNASAVA